jgi:hypothetical protein
MADKDKADIVRLNVTNWINLDAIAYIESDEKTGVVTVHFIGGKSANYSGNEAQSLLRKLPVSF